MTYCFKGAVVPVDHRVTEKKLQKEINVIRPYTLSVERDGNDNASCNWHAWNCP